MDVIQPPLSQPFQNRIHHNRPICLNQENSGPFNTPVITLLPLLSSLMPLAAILVLLLILISLSQTTFITFPAPASCTSVTSAASDPCLTLKLPPPSPPPSPILQLRTETNKNETYQTGKKKLGCKLGCRMHRRKTGLYDYSFQVLFIYP